MFNRTQLHVFKSLLVMVTLVASATVCIATPARKSSLPSQPTAADHPGSATYPFTLLRETFQVDGRTVDVFLPAEIKGQPNKVPAIVFGHGQAIDVEGYRLTFEHLAKKGVAVIHPSFDSGFFDQDWRRMAQDFNIQVEAAVQKYADYINFQNIIYSGHSKGAYVSLMAAGAPGLDSLHFRIRSLLQFAPAGYDSEFLKNLDPTITVTLAWSDSDTIIKKDLISEIYAKLPSIHKQFIQVNSYESLSADHFYPLSKKYFFGGRNGVSPYHFYGSWKWLLGGAWDLQYHQGQNENPFLYGDLTGTSGDEKQSHTVIRNF